MAAFTINLDGLTAKQLQNVQKFETKVESGKKASVTVTVNGVKQKIKFNPRVDGASTVGFTKAGATFTTFTAANAFTPPTTGGGSTGGGTTAAGQTFALTANADNLTGTAGNDTFIGFSAAGLSAATDTLFAGDVIDGGAGIDTLSVVNTATAAAALAGATIRNIETVNIRQVAAAGTSTYAADAGVTTVNNNQSAGAVTVTGLTSGSTIGVIGSGSATIGATTASYGATATKATIAFSGIGADGNGGNVTILDGAGITEVTITSSGSANVAGTIAFGTGAGTADAVTDIVINADTNLTLTGITDIVNDGATGNTITVSGKASTVSIGTLDTDVDSVNASGLTAGGIRLTTSAAAQSITGGAGNDRIQVANIAHTGTIVGGAGTDTIVFTEAANYAATAARASGFEILRVGGTGNDDSYNVGLLAGITAIEARTGAGVTVTGVSAAQASNIKILDDQTAAFGITLADTSGTSDVVTVRIDDDATTAAALTVAAITAGGVETLNLVSANALTSGAHTVSALTGSTSLTRINISGTSNFTLTNATAADTVLIDASGFTKDLTIGAADTSGIDAGDTVRGGSGDDSLFITFASLGTTTSFAAGAGDDTLTVIGNGSDIVDGDFAAISGVDNLVITSTTNTTVTLAGFAQGAIATVDANSDGRLDITAAALTTGGTIDGSNLTSRGIDVAATLTVAGTVNGTATLAVLGGAVNDTISVTTSDANEADNNDAIAVNVTAGNGLDSITLAVAEGTGTAATTVTIISTATSLANGEIITGFGATAGATYRYDYNGTLQAAPTNVGDGATLADALAVAAVDGVYIATSSIANNGSNLQGDAFQAVLGSSASTLAANYATLEAALLATGGALNGTIAGLDADISNGNAALIVLDNGVGSIVLRIVNSTTTANTITAAEIDLVGVFTNTAQLVAANFA